MRRYPTAFLQFIRTLDSPLSSRLTLGYRSNAHYPPHSHSGLTTHLVLAGELMLWYPNESDSEKVTYGVGSRIDVAAGRVHEVWMGTQGCKYVIGE